MGSGSSKSNSAKGNNVNAKENVDAQLLGSAQPPKGPWAGKTASVKGTGGSNGNASVTSSTKGAGAGAGNQVKANGTSATRTDPVKNDQNDSTVTRTNGSTSDRLPSAKRAKR